MAVIFGLGWEKELSVTHFHLAHPRACELALPTPLHFCRNYFSLFIITISLFRCGLLTNAGLYRPACCAVVHSRSLEFFLYEMSAKVLTATKSIKCKKFHIGCICYEFELLLSKIQFRFIIHVSFLPAIIASNLCKSNNFRLFTQYLF